MLRAQLAILGFALATSAQQTTPQRPFRSGVELILVDAQVVDKKGNPIPGLAAQNFQVTLDGKKRTVSSLQFIEAASGLPFGTGDLGPAPPQPAENTPAGNIYILLIDQGSFRSVNAPSVAYAVREFLKRAHSNDYIGLLSIPRPGVIVNPTRLRTEIEAAIPRLVGFSVIKQMRQFQYSLSEAIDVASRDADALRTAIARYCAPGDRACPLSLEMEMQETVSGLEAQAMRSLFGVREAVAALKNVPGRKIVVLLSAGLPSGDRSGGRLYMRSDAIQAGKEAAASGMLLYTLHLNTSFLDAFSPDAPSAVQTAMREAGVYGRGLDTFNGHAFGTFLEVNTSSDFAIDRVIRESSAYYLLGVEVDEADRDGRSHVIQVKANKGGSNVRSRPSVVIPKRGT